MPTIVWPCARIGALRQLARYGEKHGLPATLSTISEGFQHLTTGWPVTEAQLLALPEKTQAHLVDKITTNMTKEARVDTAQPSVLSRALTADPLRSHDHTTSLTGVPLQAALRKHLGLAAFVSATKFCPICALKSVTNAASGQLNVGADPRHVLATPEHMVTCKCLHGGAKTTARHDTIVESLFSELSNNGVPARKEFWPRHSSRYTKDPDTTHRDARVDVFAFNDRGTNPTAIDVVVSNEYHDTARKKRERYAPWNVDVIPAVVSLDGRCGRRSEMGGHVVTANGWMKEFTALMSGKNATRVHERVFAALWRGNCLVTRDWTEEARHAVAVLASHGYNAFCDD
ncbi:hypothetical protein J8273_7620 [Carpediemonas membranifera]|uniref:Uncharacterized protein n=1 Tax=Carpediemonas membranifera TaxID=201153 RepID=A0A8J6DZW3_9EUKA|nr:hypothetical protein J8273_7620 [Carpediemonas membranifera]|eukprot:KAG9391298.1 hypothetical protein J8273_7620 [Carpediemonas membranifera]